MFFKSLEIQGFKSFPDKTVLHFDSKMTAVVGSNGNGKSNISDALRWVMGEQGAKTLRSDKMEDVIFHGTVSRNQMGFAKVALTVDNTDRALNVDSDEVIITRKLYRTGDSEYLINSDKVRLKDITELLMGTGLGRDGYSIIGQGRIGEIVNAKGTQRREIFDEAAGVSKFLHKKQEAERDLERANDNILRLKDIASELEERLPTLEKQSEKARKAQVLLEEEKTLEISVSVSEMNSIAENMAQIDDDILMNESECEHFEREIEALERESENVSEEKMRGNSHVDELRNAEKNARDEIAEKQKDIAVLENDIRHNDERINELKQKIADSEKGREEFDEQIKLTEKAITEKKAKCAEIIGEIEKNNEKLTGKSDENSKLDEQSKEVARRLNALYASKTEAELHLANAVETLGKSEQELDETKERIANQGDLLAEYRRKKRALSDELDEITANRQENENKADGYGRLLSAKKEKLEGMKGEFDALKRTYDQKRSRLDVISDVEKNMTGYQPSVRNVMNAAKAGKLSDIHGTVADIIRVPKEYTIAIETALGFALQNIIVSNEESAKRCMRYLKDTNGGRATFLPITSVSGRTMDYPELRNEDGYEGLGSDLVSYEQKYENIIRSLLGKTVVVDDIDSATFIAKKYGYKFRIITLDGQIINAGGSFTGGSVKETSGIISRKNELEALRGEVEKLSDTIEITKGTFSGLQAEVNKLQLETEGLRDIISSVKNEEVRVTAEIGGISNLIKQCNEQQDASETIISRHEAQIAAQKSVIEKYKSQKAEAEAEIAVKESEAEQVSGMLASIIAEHKALSDGISALKITEIETKKDIENLLGQVKNLENSKNSIGLSNTVSEEEIERIKASTGQLTAQIMEKRAECDDISGRYASGQSEIVGILQKINELEQRATQLNKEIREKIDDKEKFSNALVRAQERKANAEREDEKIKASLWEKYELAPSEARKAASPISDIAQAKSRLQELHRKISALGTINFASIDEYAEVSQRYELLASQLGDIEASRRDLEKLIANLTADIKARFLASFKDINEHFGVIFKEIFGGGEGRLELTDPDDILSSGIEIFAAPPGKVIKNLISLSGGEQAMVAITIYFAILLHRPTPFCMLDEVDAALDDINVVKYISYLKRFSDSTQLMVITHRRGTIECCDVLYGVYMQEKGVSRLLRQEIIDDLDIELD